MRDEIGVATASTAARLGTFIVLSTIGRRHVGAVQLNAARRLATLVLLWTAAGILQAAIINAGRPWRTVERTIVHWSVKLANWQFSFKLDKLWLNGGRVNAFIVKELLHFLGNFHVVVQVATANVRRGDDSIASQLPDVKLMNCQNSVNVFQ